MNSGCEKCCFVCGNSSVSQSQLSSEDEEKCKQNDEIEQSPIKQNQETNISSNPFQILLEAVLRVKINSNDGLNTLYHLCLKCSNDLTTFHRLADEIKRLELLSKSLRDGFIDSTINSLVQLSQGAQKCDLHKTFLLEDAVSNLKKSPVEFKIYKRWRTRFLQKFRFVEKQNESPSRSSISISEDTNMNETFSINLSPENAANIVLTNTAKTSDIDNEEKEIRAVLVHDHSYGVSLTDNGDDSNDEIENKAKQNLYVRKTLESSNQDQILSLEFHECTMCDRKFRRKATFNKHLKYGHLNHVACSQCLTVFACKKDLLQHIRNSHEETISKTEGRQGSAQDLILNESSNSIQKKYNQSKVELNIPVKQIEEDIVLEKTKNNSNTNNTKCSVDVSNEPHRKRIKSSGRIQCNRCDKTYSRTRDLMHHMRSHTGERPFTCEHCKKSFLDNRQLRIHTRIHTGEKPYICEICGDGFSSLAGFHSHRRTHAKLRPYKCQQCSVNFRSSGQLKKHELIHSGEKPFSCNICQKSFNRKENLRIHEYTHTSSKPYKCSRCPQSYVRAFLLRNHIVEYHSTETDENDNQEVPPLVTTTTDTPIVGEPPEVDLFDTTLHIVTLDSSGNSYPHLNSVARLVDRETINVVPGQLFISESGEQFVLIH